MSFLLTEGRDRVGGNITTVSNDEGYLWEEGPNSFQPSDAMLKAAVRDSHIHCAAWQYCSSASLVNTAPHRLADVDCNNRHVILLQRVGKLFEAEILPAWRHGGRCSTHGTILCR